MIVVSTVWLAANTEKNVSTECICHYKMRSHSYLLVRSFVCFPSYECSQFWLYTVLFDLKKPNPKPNNNKTQNTVLKLTTTKHRFILASWLAYWNSLCSWCHLFLWALYTGLTAANPGKIWEKSPTKQTRKKPRKLWVCFFFFFLGFSCKLL